MRDLGAAIIGTGFMGPTHTEALWRLGVPVRGILGSSPAKSREAADALGLPRAYRTYAEVLEDPSVKVVHVATPNRVDLEQARGALEAGKHVLCEKPLAMTSAESASLVELAARRPKQAAGVNYNLRYYPLNLEARRRVRAGELGRLFHVAGGFVQDWLLYDTDYNWRVLADQGGDLRVVADIGTHWLDLIGWMTGLEVESLCADLATVHPVRRRPRGEVQTFSGGSSGPTDAIPITTEDYGAILLRFAGGVRGTLWCSQVTAGRKCSLSYEVAGERSALAWNSERHEELWIGHRGQPNEILPKDPSLLQGEARAGAAYPGGHAEGYPDTFKQCFRSFYDYIEKGDFAGPPPFPTFADGHREIVLCEAVLRSHREGAWVKVPAR